MTRFLLRRGVSGQATGEQVGAAATLGGLFHPKMRLVGMRNCNASTTVALGLMGEKRVWFARIWRGASGQVAREQVGAATTSDGFPHPQMRPSGMRNCSVRSRHRNAARSPDAGTGAGRPSGGGGAGTGRRAGAGGSGGGQGVAGGAGGGAAAILATPDRELSCQGPGAQAPSAPSAFSTRATLGSAPRRSLPEKPGPGPLGCPAPASMRRRRQAGRRGTRRGVSAGVFRPLPPYRWGGVPI